MAECPAVPEMAGDERYRATRRRSIDGARPQAWAALHLRGHPVAEPVAAASRGLAFPDAAPHVR